MLTEHVCSNFENWKSLERFKSDVIFFEEFIYGLAP